MPGLTKMKNLYNNFINNVSKVFNNVTIPKTIQINNEMNLNEELLEWFQMIGNAEFSVIDILCGLEPLSYENMIKEWTSWREFDENRQLNDAGFYSSVPENAVKCLYSNPKWIPIAHDHSGNYIGVDLDPAEKGVAGQIINFGRDENEKYVFANSLTQFLELLIENQEDMVDVNGCYTNEDDEHTIDWLKEIIESE